MTPTLLEGDLQQADTTTMRSGHWLSVVSHLDPRYGGLSAVVPQLGLQVERCGGTKVNLAAFCFAEEFSLPGGFEADRIGYWPASRMAWLRDRTLGSRFRETMRACKGVHIHGLWEQSTATASKMARELGKPYIISAHGMLEPWALKHKQLKKYLYAKLLERSNVQGAACLHALTEAEARNYRRFGALGPIAIIPNGVALPETLSSALFLRQFPELRGKRIFLFLSRLHPKKGLDLLVEAWSSVQERWPEAHLVIAGPDFEGTRATIEKMVQDHQVEARVTFTGMLQGAMKWSALAAAECFVLPSHSEGLSMSALEAMGAGLPVIVTEPCNMPEVKRLDLGWEIEPMVDSLAFAMKEALGNSEAENRGIGARGKQLIAQRYGWHSVGQQMSELYRWVEGGPAPKNVEVLHG